MLTRKDDVDAHAVRRQGWTITAIAKHLGHDRMTIWAYLAGDCVAGEDASSHPDPLEPFLAYATQRLLDHPHVWGTTLFDEFGALGYPLSYRASLGGCADTGCGRPASRTRHRLAGTRRSSTTRRVRKPSGAGPSRRTRRCRSWSRATTRCHSAWVAWPRPGGSTGWPRSRARIPAALRRPSRRSRSSTPCTWRCVPRGTATARAPRRRPTTPPRSAGGGPSRTTSPSRRRSCRWMRTALGSGTSDDAVTTVRPPRSARWPPRSWSGWHHCRWRSPPSWLSSGPSARGRRGPCPAAPATVAGLVTDRPTAAEASRAAGPIGATDTAAPPLSASRPDRAVTLDQGVHQHQDTPRRDVRPAVARAASRAASSSRQSGRTPPAGASGEALLLGEHVGSAPGTRPVGATGRSGRSVATGTAGTPGSARAELKDNVEETSVTEPRPGRRAPPCAGWPELAAAPRAPERSTTPVDPLLPPAAAFEDPQRPLSPSEPTGPGDTLSASAPKVPDDPAAPVTEPCASVRCTSGSRRSHRPSCRARQG